MGSWDRRWGKSPFEEVGFHACDGLRLAGWFIPAPRAHGAVILCHGFPHNRTEMLPWAKLLHPAGYHLLLFDFRAHGESAGSLSSIGYYEINDLLGAVDYLVTRPEMKGLQVGVFGLSMGGAVALMAAAQDERIAAVATHGAYASLKRAIDQRFRLFFGPLARLMSAPAIWWGRRWLPTDPGIISPVEVIYRISPRPVLLMHGARDFLTHPDDGRALYHAARPPKCFYLAPRSWHTRLHPKERPGYEEKLLGFLGSYLA